MRRALLLLPLALAACDVFGGPDPTSADALTGAWTAERSYSGTVVVSDRDQDIVDITAQARRGLEVSGAVDAELDFLHYAFPGSHAGFGTARQNDPSCWISNICPGFARLVADAAAERFQLWAGGDIYEGAPPDIEIRQTPTGYALAPFTLTRDGASGGASVTVGGEIVLATRPLSAGRPTPVASFNNSPSYLTGSTGYDFRADGTYTLRDHLGERAGTWAVTEPGMARLTPERGSAHGLAFEIRDGRLWTGIVPDGALPSGGASEIEGQSHAVPGSLTLVGNNGVTVSARAD